MFTHQSRPLRIPFGPAAEFGFDVRGRLPLFRYFLYSFASAAVGVVYSIPHGPKTVIQWVFFAFSVMGCTAAYGAAAGLVFRPAHQSLSLVANSNRALSRMVRRERARLERYIHADSQTDLERASTSTPQAVRTVTSDSEVGASTGVGPGISATTVVSPAPCTPLFTMHSKMIPLKEGRVAGARTSLRVCNQ